jgi:hypothetical protein
MDSANCHAFCEKARQFAPPLLAALGSQEEWLYE